MTSIKSSSSSNFKTLILWPILLIGTVLLLTQLVEGQQNDRNHLSSITRALITSPTAAAAATTTTRQRAHQTSLQLPNKQYQSQKRDLGLIAIKAILLGPLIGLTIKAALIRGLIWAVLAYGLHLFFPALLSSLGLGTGLVGFARQLRPDYSHLLANHLSNLHIAMPNSFNQMARQYRQVLSPVIESIRSIPEGHCRLRAVCETASHLIRQARSMSTTLQRISATVYMNFGTDYSKAWLDGIVQSDCAAKYIQCQASPFSMVAARLAQSLGVGQQQVAMQQATSQLFASLPTTAQEQQQQALMGAVEAAASGSGQGAATAATSETLAASAQQQAAASLSAAQ